MNVRLRKQIAWYSGLVYQDRFCVNHYNAEMTMLTVSRDHDQQNIAYDRLKFWIGSVLDDSILIHSENPLLSMYEKTGARLIVLPEEPVDQILGIMLYLKLNSIMQNRIVITDIEICSTQGDQMSYTHSHGESLGPHLGQDGWWTDARPTWTWNRSQDPNDKVVNLDRTSECKDYGLDWDHAETNKDSVVFANFGRDENK